MKGIRKVYCFCKKKSIERGKGLDLGVKRPHVIILGIVAAVVNSFFFYSCYGPADCVGSSNKCIFNLPNSRCRKCHVHFIPI